MGNFVTNGEHDEMMRDQRTALNSIASSLRRANAIASLKELYVIEAISKQQYQESLKFILQNEGFTGIKFIDNEGV